jgi:hypothetical protein
VIASDRNLKKAPQGRQTGGSISRNVIALGPSDKLAPLKVARGAGAFSAFCNAPLQTTAAWAAAYCAFSWRLLKRYVDCAGHDGIEKADE